MSNFYEKYDWPAMLSRHAASSCNIAAYHNILCPKADYPHFLNRYLALPLLKRLSGVGLLCGTDWTPLYKNRFYYSRLDHSLGVALIVWHFTHDKAQTLAGLLHDVSTPVFSHVSDFRKGDALTQTATEAPTAAMLRRDQALNELLREDGLTCSQVEDYHLYPIADNEIPQLSADRLEYMFPSGLALDGSWTLEQIRRCYEDLEIFKNEEARDELGFKTLETAELYCEHFCMIGHILQLNENKLALHLLGQIMNLAEEQNILSENDFMSLSEQEIITKLDQKLTQNNRGKLSRLYRTFRTMTKIEHTSIPLDSKKYYCLKLDVKQRYINPLVKIEKNNENSQQAVRLSELSTKAKKIIEDFKTYRDSDYGCVRLVAFE